MADLVRQRLGTYQLLQLLGSGGFADVYLGEHVYLKTKVAVKVLHAHLGHKERERFKEEASLVASLVHPHIIRILHFDIDIQNNIPFLVMEYAPNGSLRDRYPEGTRVQLQTIVSYVKQIASALQYAHDEKKMVHRDISPENLLLGQNDEILVSDFGLAVLTRSYLTEPLGFAGKFYYMAPEQIKGVPHRASDQYALGIVVYEWISGSLPFDGTVIEVLSQHLTVPPPPFKKTLEISPQIEQVVMKALAKDPQDRYPNVQAFANALELAVSQRPKVVPRPVTPLPQTPSLPVQSSPIQKQQAIKSSPTIAQAPKEGKIIYPRIIFLLSLMVFFPVVIISYSQPSFLQANPLLAIIGVTGGILLLFDWLLVVIFAIQREQWGWVAGLIFLSGLCWPLYLILDPED